MSTYWYLECTDHEPPLRSADEVEQHTYGLPDIRAIVANRELYVASVAAGMIPGGYFERNAVSFIVEHPACALRLVSEYGVIEEVTS